MAINMEAYVFTALDYKRETACDTYLLRREERE